MAPNAGQMAAETLASGYVGQGPKVDEFELAFAHAVGLERMPLGVTSCTTAIDLALHLTGVGPGDEVVTSPMTCTATNGPIVTRGARPVWADVDPLTGLIDPADVARKIASTTKAIIAVDWGGAPCDYRELKKAACGLPIIQDAAHRLFPTNPGGDYVCWSFGPIKHLTCGGSGGALLPPASQYDRARLLRWHGLDRLSKADFRCEQDITEVGYRAHLTDDLATVGLANLGMARENVRKAQENAKFYTRVFAGAPGITVQPFDAASDYWLYTLLVEDRASFLAFLAERGVMASPVHARNDTHTAFRRAAGETTPLPGVDHFAARNVAIPCGWWLTSADREKVAAAVLTWGQKQPINEEEEVYAYA